MKDFDTNKVRNIAFAGHNGSGKTSLAEAILYKAGASDRLGKTADGTTVCDYDPEEIKRKISIGTSLASFKYNDCKINILDTPGLFDFAAEMIEGIRAADTVMITVSAKSGVKIGAKKMAIRNRKPVTTEARPVLAPAPTPAELSTNVVVVEVPNTAPAEVATASASNAILILGSFSSLSSMSAFVATPISVPIVSNISTNRNAKMTTIKFATLTLE